jgi:hypothetical protein
LPLHWGLQLASHLPPMQACELGQVPQVPPQPSGPQLLLAQLGVQVSVQLPLEQKSPSGQLPQELPQPSSPQLLPVQSPSQVGTHARPPGEQNASPQQLPQMAPQPSSPQTLPLQSGTQPEPPSGLPASLRFSATRSSSDPAHADNRSASSQTALSKRSIEARLAQSAALRDGRQSRRARKAFGNQTQCPLTCAKMS